MGSLMATLLQISPESADERLENRSTFGKVIGKNRVSCFCDSLSCIYLHLELSRNVKRHSASPTFLTTHRPICILRMTLAI